MEETQTATTPTEHIAYEVGAEVFAKPSALCDLLEVDGNAVTLIFCQMPSDTDLVKVILRKRGIKAQKLIGHIPESMSAKALRDAQSGIARVLVATDIGARHIDPNSVDVVINYSIPADPEAYTHRTQGQSGEKRLTKVINLVSALDHANFHFIKKTTGIDIQIQALPSREEVLRKKLDNWATTGKEMNLLADESFATITKGIQAHANSAEIIAFLTHSAMNQAVAEDRSSSHDRGERGERSERGGEDEEFEGGRGDRRERRRGRGRRDDDDEGGRSSNGGSYNEGPNGHQGPPPERQVRIYIGHGQRDGFSEERFKGILKDSCGAEESTLKRFLLRDLYSFADLAEESADDVISRLNDARVEGDTPLFVKRATTILSPRAEGDRPAQQAETGTTAEMPVAEEAEAVG